MFTHEYRFAFQALLKNYANFWIFSIRIGNNFASVNVPFKMLNSCMFEDGNICITFIYRTLAKGHQPSFAIIRYFRIFKIASTLWISLMGRF